MLVTKDGKQLLTVTCGKFQINIINIETMNEVESIKEKHIIASIALSRNQKYIYVNTSFSKPAIHVWTLVKPQLIQKWTGTRRFMQDTTRKSTFLGWTVEGPSINSSL